MSDLVHVKGLSKLEAALTEFATKTVKSIARESLKAGAVVLRDAARARAPVGPPSSEGAKLYGGFLGALRASIRVAGTKTKGTRVTASVKVGGKFGGADVFYAHMVEFGTRPHTITAKGLGFLSFGGHFFRSVHHPGVSPYGTATIGPHAFMRPALDTQKTAIVIAVGESMKLILSSKHGVNTSGIDIGGAS